VLRCARDDSRNHADSVTSPLDALLARFTALHPRIIDLSLGRIERLMPTLGHPEGKLPPVVHVAGTNGKGSAVAFMRAALEAAGCRSHVYTSPHLVRFNERIVLAGREIEDAPLTQLLERVEAANAGAEITFFEITTAAAFLAFAETSADILLLEVGLGGRLDATNLVARPVASCITPIDLDHQKYLGDTLAAIAAEKAGILKPRIPAVISEQRPAAMAPIAMRAEEIGTPLLIENRDWRAVPGKDGFRYEGPRWRLDLPRPGLLGAHQIRNAGAALACLEQLAAFEIGAAALAQGIANARWPARLQRLTKGPLAKMLPPDWQLWLDGAHNPHGASALAAWLDAEKKPAHLVIAMLDSKDPAGFFEELRGRFASVRTVPVPSGHSGLDPAGLAETARRAGHDAKHAADAAAAIAEIVARAPPGPALLMIAGSLYLAGAILAENG
jgi:dihydrofolate synthase/folylpolyglutamate synthase